MSTDNHASDCATHNGPAYPAGPCDCGRDQSPTHTVVSAESGKLVYRDVTMVFHRASLALPVAYMFDAQGSETYDPTEAVEVDADGDLIRLTEGDRITMTVEV